MPGRSQRFESYQKRSPAATHKEPAFFNEWIDSFYARDVLELFGIRNRQGFLSLFRRGRDRVDVLECKINPGKFDAKPIETFRDMYPKGDNYVVSPAVKKPYGVRRGDLVFTVCTTRDLA